MRVLELFFNTKLKPDTTYESWCFEPEKKQEKKLGSLYIVAESTEDLQTLNDLASVISESYYSAEYNNFETAINRANQKIKERALANLNIVVLALTHKKIKFSRVGNLNILLLNQEEILDIGQNLDQADLFKNIASGELQFKDKILVVNEEVIAALRKQSMISKILPLTRTRKIKAILNLEKYSKASGIALLIILTKPGKLKLSGVGGRSKQFLGPFYGLKELATLLTKIRPTIKPLKKLTGLISLVRSLTRIRPSRIFKLSPLVSDRLRKGIILTFLLGLVVGTGVLVMEKQKQAKITAFNEKLDLIQNQVTRAEQLMTSENKEQAQPLLIKNLDKIEPLTKTDLPTQPRAISLRQRIKTNLFELNHLKMLDQPAVVTKFDSKQMVPKKIIVKNSVLYVFSPYQENMYKIEADRQKLIKSSKFRGGTRFKDKILFFAEANSLFSYQKKFTQYSLNLPYSEFTFTDISGFGPYFYLLDKEKGEILRGKFLPNKKSQTLELWLADQQPKLRDVDCLAIDGSIWTLNDNIIKRYYAGQYQETLDLDFFPKLERGTKIHTRSWLPYLYLLDPGHHRVIILNKRGKVIQQFSSPKFKQLKDFAVSETGKEIYLLSGQKIYKISF